MRTFNQWLTENAMSEAMEPFYTVQFPNGWFLGEKNQKTPYIQEAAKLSLKDATLVAKAWGDKGATVYHFGGI